MKRLPVSLALCLSIAAAVVPAAAAAPPAAPPGCQVVLTTPAASTGSAQGQAEKMRAYAQVCLP